MSEMLPEEKIEMLERKLTLANRSLTDRSYMMAALAKMLGPKGQQVWRSWCEQGIQRIHFNWGPDGANVIGEDAAEMHLQIEEACKSAVPLTTEELAEL